MQISSPITNRQNVVFQEDLNIQNIIEAYQRDFNIDVSTVFSGIDTVKIYRCLDTGYRFFYPLTLTGESELYEELQKHPWYYSIRPEHRAAKAFFAPHDRVLEIGCGKALFLEELKEIGVEYTGLEFNDSAVRSCQERGINVLKQDIQNHANQFPAYYDVVCSFQVLEHIEKVHDFIHHSINALKHGGRMIVGVPNNNPFLFKYDKFHTLNLPPHHMGLWDESSLVNLRKFFSIRLDYILVEPLQPQDYDYFFGLQVKNIRSRSRLLGKIAEITLLRMRPNKLKQQLQRLLSRFFQGRNILVVYTKI